MEVLQRTANRGSISTGYDIDNSLKFEEDNTEMMEQNPSAGGNRRTFTVSLWMKRSEISTTGNSQWIIGAIGASETAALSIDPSDVIFLDVGLGSTRNRMGTTQVFRDTSAWYHLVWRVDTTQGTAADRNRLYVNGVLAPLTAVDGYPTQNFECEYNNDKLINIGHYQAVNNNGLCGYLAEIHSCDGVSNAPTEFGEFDADSGIWKPKAYAGSYGAQGFYLPLDNSSDLGANSKGNSVDFTLQNITAADQSTDTPTNNFCTLNPLNRNSATASNNPTYTEGNTRTTGTLNGYWQTAIASIGVTSGKWYMEGQLIYDPQMAGIGVGDFGDIENWGRNNDWIGAGKAVAYGTPKAEVGDSLPATANDYTNSNIIGVALDADNGKVYWSRDNIYQSSMNPVTGANGISIPTGGDAEGLYMFGVSGYKATHGSYTGNVGWLVNFGGFTNISISSAASDANGYGTFEYAPPSGYYALCTKNLAEFG